MSSRQPSARAATGFSRRCPVCQASPGVACLSRVDGQMLAGMHFRRTLLGRRAASAALAFYTELYAPAKKPVAGAVDQGLQFDRTA
jgi:hypothetical protein